jgi:hypothetical protein
MRIAPVRGGADCFAERSVNYVCKDAIHVKSSRNAGRTETERARTAVAQQTL